MSESLRAAWARHRALAHAALCALVVLGVGALKLGNGFVWDDVPLLAQSGFLFDLGNLPALFLHNTMFAADGGAFASIATLDTYRPLTLLTFMLDGWIFGRAPWGFHLTNLLLHLGVVLLTLHLGGRWLRPDARALAWAPALAVGLHPLLAEAHVWINGRSDVLAALFALAALALLTPDLLLADARLRLGRLLGAAALLLLGMLCKETVVMTLPALVLLGLAPSRSPWRAWAWRRAAQVAAAGAAALAAYLALRWLALGGLKTHDGSAHLGLALWRMPLYVLDGAARLLLPGATAVRFVKESYDPLHPAWFGAAWAVALAALGLGLYAARRAPRLVSGALWFALGVAPASLTGVLLWYGFGRYLYLPAAWLLVVALDALVAAVTRWAPQLRRLLPLALALYLGALGVSLALSIPDWRDEASFYAAIQRDYPEQSHGWGGWGRYLLQRGDAAQAIPFLERAVALAPHDSRYLNNLAQAHLRAGDLPAATAAARRGIDRFPHEAKFFHIAGLTLLDTHPPQAVALLLEAAQRPHGGEPSWRLLGEVLQRHPQRDHYRHLLRQAMPSLSTPAQRRLTTLLDEPAP